ncbi:SDR family oxidoreductase [Curtobacterium sp. MCBD17_040]|uniref:SDR family oxidoreductase n=1 Tax=Curtobacterium sp. MCBD17_040 TaxID=2175674 RepID=UPI0024DF6798|nr:SDR family oxidoreductase [Curtobacterium sp. MCBD17_040]WIB63019.1 SDR family oxidoreductase [Curtobacterium sp. MCBD17_040]
MTSHTDINGRGRRDQEEVAQVRVFITGASGWIGSAVVDELLAHGHQVIGLARSDASAASIEAKGAEVLRGDLDTLDVIRAGSEAADAVVHLANKHDWANQAETNRAERAAVQTIGDALVGTGKPFLVAAGVAGLTPGRAVTEADPNPSHGPDAPRGGTENLALEFADRGVVPVSLRFAPTVHGDRDHGFIALIADADRRAGTAAYVGDGEQRWAAVHVQDAARAVRLALEQASPGLIVHVVAEEGVPTRAIAEAIGAFEGLPVASVDPAAAQEHFGFIGMFFGMDLSAESSRTHEVLGWTPTGPTLLEDIAAGAYRA